MNSHFSFLFFLPSSLSHAPLSVRDVALKFNKNAEQVGDDDSPRSLSLPRHTSQSGGVKHKNCLTAHRPGASSGAWDCVTINNLI